MRRAGLALVMLVCATVVAGCLDRRPTVPSIVRSMAPPIQVEGIVVDSVLIEQPRGDSFLDRELWASALPAGQPETRALFAENGLRVGIISGSPPQRFQALLDSESDTVSPQRLTFHLRKELVVPTAGPFEVCKFAVLTDLAGKPSPFELKQARSGVLVRPLAAPDRRVKLWCEPQVQHGTQQEWFRPTEDGTQFARTQEVPLEKFAELGFDAIIGPDDYLIIGWSAEETESLGEVLFAAEVGDRPRQRILVIRARQVTPMGAPDLPPIAGSAKRPAVASIAGTARK
jgi:hypothetical protein